MFRRHALHSFAADKNVACEIDGNRIGNHLRIAGVQAGGFSGDASGVHHVGHGPKSLFRFCEHALHVDKPGDITLHGDRIASQILDQRFGCVFIAHVVDGNRITFDACKPGSGGTNAPGTTCNEKHLGHRFACEMSFKAAAGSSLPSYKALPVMAPASFLASGCSMR